MHTVHPSQMRREMWRGGQGTEGRTSVLKLYKKTHEEQEMIIKSQSRRGQKALSMAINWPVPPRAEYLQIPDPAPSGIKKCGAISCILQSWRGERRLHLSPLVGRVPFFTQFSSAHPGFPSCAASSKGNAMRQRCFGHFGHHQSCPKKSLIGHCSLGGVTKWARGSEYPQTSPDWVYQPTYYYLRNFLKENGLQNRDDLMLHL